MRTPTKQFSLGYTEQWIALGVVTSADMQRDIQKCTNGDDPHPEHYRWRAFIRFLAMQPRLSAALAHHLYALGDSDADHAMGSSMMAEVLRHRDCPFELLHSARTSKHRHLQHLAAQRLDHDK